jgi:hypothetical protein
MYHLTCLLIYLRTFPPQCLQMHPRMLHFLFRTRRRRSSLSWKRRNGGILVQQVVTEHNTINHLARTSSLQSLLGKTMCYEGHVSACSSCIKVRHSPQAPCGSYPSRLSPFRTPSYPAKLLLPTSCSSSSNENQGLVGLGFRILRISLQATPGCGKVVDCGRMFISVWSTADLVLRRLSL